MFLITSTTMIDTRQIADQLTAAFEGGSNHWIVRVEPPFENRKGYSEASAYGPDMIERVIFADDDDTPYPFTIASITAGLSTLAEIYPSHWGDIIQDEGDADTGDALLQCILFGELVYA